MVIFHGYVSHNQMVQPNANLPASHFTAKVILDPQSARVIAGWITLTEKGEVTAFKKRRSYAYIYIYRIYLSDLSIHPSIHVYIYHIYNIIYIYLSHTSRIISGFFEPVGWKTPFSDAETDRSFRAEYPLKAVMVTR